MNEFTSGIFTPPIEAERFHLILSPDVRDIVSMTALTDGTVPVQPDVTISTLTGYLLVDLDRMLRSGVVIGGLDLSLLTYSEQSIEEMIRLYELINGQLNWEHTWGRKIGTLFQPN